MKHIFFLFQLVYKENIRRWQHLVKGLTSHYETKQAQGYVGDIVSGIWAYMKSNDVVWQELEDSLRQLHAEYFPSSGNGTDQVDLGVDNLIQDIDEISTASPSNQKEIHENTKDVLKILKQEKIALREELSKVKEELKNYKDKDDKQKKIINEKDKLIADLQRRISELEQDIAVKETHIDALESGNKATMEVLEEYKKELEKHKKFFAKVESRHASLKYTSTSGRVTTRREPMDLQLPALTLSDTEPFMSGARPKSKGLTWKSLPEDITEVVPQHRYVSYTKAELNFLAQTDEMVISPAIANTHKMPQKATKQKITKVSYKAFCYGLNPCCKRLGNVLLAEKLQSTNIEIRKAKYLSFCYIFDSPDDKTAATVQYDGVTKAQRMDRKSYDIAKELFVMIESNCANILVCVIRNVKEGKELESITKHELESVKLLVKTQLLEKLDF